MSDLLALNRGDLTKELRPMAHQAGGGTQESLLIPNHEATRSLAAHGGPHRVQVFLGTQWANLGHQRVLLTADVGLGLLVHIFKLLEVLFSLDHLEPKWNVLVISGLHHILLIRVRIQSLSLGLNHIVGCLLTTTFWFRLDNVELSGTRILLGADTAFYLLWFLNLSNFELFDLFSTSIVGSS